MKKILALALALLMVVGMVPMAFAAVATNNDHKTYPVVFVQDTVIQHDGKIEAAWGEPTLTLADTGTTSFPDLGASATRRYTQPASLS